MRPQWWVPLPPVSATLACSGTVHEVRWERGAFHVPSHGDVEAEKALGALGASPPQCLRVRSAWMKAIVDPVLVTLGRRPGEASIGSGEEAALAVQTAPEPSRRAALLLVFSLPAAFIDRAALGAAAASAERWGDPDFRELHGLRLGAALAARAQPALRRLAGALARSDDAVALECTPGPGTEGATIRAARSARGLEVTATLGLEWIATVWGAGISEVDGRMVLSVDDADDDGDRISIRVAEWQPSGANRWEAALVPAVLERRSEGGWQLT